MLLIDHIYNFDLVVPKNYCLLDVQFGDYNISCYGEQLAIKPLERFCKKIKKIMPPTYI